MHGKYSKEKFEQSIKLTEVQKRWLDNYLEAARDRQSERLYETTPRVRKVQGIWKQIYL